MSREMIDWFWAGFGVGGIAGISIYCGVLILYEIVKGRIEEWKNK